MFITLQGFFLALMSALEGPVKTPVRLEGTSTKRHTRLHMDVGKQSTSSSEKGVQERALLLRYRVMVWELRAGCWQGKWQWSPWEKRGQLEKRIAASQDSAIHGWDTGDIPQEILLRVIENAAEASLSPIGTSTATISRAGRRLGNLALVCRAWNHLISPTLYSHMCIPSTLTDAVLRQSTAKCVQAITVRSSWPCVTPMTLTRRNPCLRSSLVSLAYQASGVTKYNTNITSSHPTHLAICAQHNRSLRGVTRLNVTGCHFLSSTDLLKMLTSFPALELACLTTLFVTDVIQFAFVRAGHDPSRLRCVEVRHCDQPLSFLVHTMTGQHASPHLWLPPFRGLPYAERLAVAGICELTARN